MNFKYRQCPIFTLKSQFWSMHIGRAAPLVWIGLLLFYGNLAVGQIGELPKHSSSHVTFFTIADGLPSNETYDLEIDQQGAIWICTDNGVARYDGVSFEKINLPKVSNTVLGVEMAPDGNLWFFTIKGEIFSCNPISLECERRLGSHDILGELGAAVITKLHFNDDKLVLYVPCITIVFDDWQHEGDIRVYRAPVDQETSIKHIFPRHFSKYNEGKIKDSLDRMLSRTDKSKPR